MPNFIQIGWKTQKLKIFTIGRFWLVGLVGRAGWSKNGRSHFKHSESLKRLIKDLCTKFEPNRTKIGEVSPFWNFFSKIEIWLVGPVCMCEIGSRIRIQSAWPWQVSMQKINSIAQSVLELSHRENADNDNDNDDDDTLPGWIIVRVGMYSVADKNQCISRLQHISRWQDKSKLKNYFTAIYVADALYKRIGLSDWLFSLCYSYASAFYFSRAAMECWKSGKNSIQMRWNVCFPSARGNLLF